MKSCTTIIAVTCIVIAIIITVVSAMDVGSRPTRTTTVTMQQCFTEDAVAYYADNSSPGSPVIKTARFAQGTQVSVLGSDDDYGEIEIKVGPGLAFRYRGTTYAVQAKYLEPC